MKSSGREGMLAVLLTIVALSVGASLVWVFTVARNTTFSAHPEAKKIAVAQEDGSVIIRYARCSNDEVNPYIDAWEVVGDDLHEWEVHALLWGPDEASWTTGRNAVGDEGSTEPPKAPYEGTLPSKAEIRMNIEVYSASIDNRSHVRIDDLPLSDLPDMGMEPREVLTAEGERLTESAWHQKARSGC